MPDGELAEGISAEERADVDDGEAVSRVGRKAGLVEAPRRALDARELAVDAVGAPRVRVVAGVNLHDRGPRAAGRVREPLVGIEEEAHRDAGIDQPPAPGGKRLRIPAQVEPALRRELGSSLGHERGAVGMRGERNPDHLVGERHLQIQHAAVEGANPRQVVVLNVAAILTQVDRDPRGPRLEREDGRADGIGLVAAAGLAQRGHVVDVDAQLGLHGDPAPTGAVIGPTSTPARSRSPVRPS